MILLAFLVVFLLDSLWVVLLVKLLMRPLDDLKRVWTNVLILLVFPIVSLLDSLLVVLLLRLLIEPLNNLMIM